jgi:predicted transcriptional regulator
MKISKEESEFIALLLNKELRHWKGVYLAKKLEIHPSYLCQIKKGQREPSYKVVNRIKDAFPEMFNKK